MIVPTPCKPARACGRAERFFVRAAAAGGGSFCVWADPAHPPRGVPPGADGAFPALAGDRFVAAAAPARRLRGPWQHLVAASLAEAFSTNEPLVRVLHATDSGRVGLVLHHALADGRSGMALLSGWLDGAPPAAPWLGLDGALPDWCADQQHVAQAERAWRKDMIRHGWPLRLPGHDPARPAGPVAWRSVALQAPGLRRAAAAAGVRVNALLAAALLRALRGVAPGAGSAPVMLTTAVDLRARLGLGDALGLLVSLVPGVHPVEPAAPLAPLARSVQAGLEAQLARGDGCMAWHWLDPERSAGQGPSGVVLSNLGDVRLPGARAAGLLVVPLPAQPLVATATTCGSTTELALVWRAGRLDAATAAAVMQGWRAGLEQCVADAPPQRRESVASAPGRKA